MEKVISIRNGQKNYLNRKINEYNQRFGEEHLSIYLDFYEDIPHIELRKLFSIFHYHFNDLFTYLNSRKSTGHYTAPESRLLIYWIDELKSIQSNVADSEFNFEIDSFYKQKLSECERFLSESGGSSIPEEFEKIQIIEVQPIFNLKHTISITRTDKKVLFSTKPIGEGSYASVHKYKDEFYNRFFVIKKAFKNLKEDEYTRFKIEFEEMKKLKSPYVIEVYKFDEENQEYIMEYADETLDSYISRNNTKLDINERVGLVRQIFRAFIYINGKGVLHRDISTKNILIKKYEGLNIIKVADFGLVKREDSLLTNKNTDMKGSLNDPKLEIIGFRNYETQHEIYALTRLVYFVMTGKLRFNSYLNKEFEIFIKKGISDNVNDRYKNVQELQDAFNRIVTTLE